ncbi:MAG: hypothetical protein ACOX02_00515 [Acholeplasmatales bacterium]
MCLLSNLIYSLFERLTWVFIFFFVIFGIGFIFSMGFMVYIVIRQDKIIKKQPEVMDAEIEEKKASAELKRSVANKGVNISINADKDKK